MGVAIREVTICLEEWCIHGGEAIGCGVTFWFRVGGTRVRALGQRIRSPNCLLQVHMENTSTAR